METSADFDPQSVLDQTLQELGVSLTDGGKLENGLEMRLATPSDAPGIAQLDRANFAQEAWSQDSFSDEISLSDRAYLVAVEDLGLGREIVVSAAGLRCAEVSEILTISTLSAWRRQGLAKISLKFLINVARAWGSAELWLEVRSKNLPAQQMYLTAGFEKVGLRRRYYGDDDAYTMRLYL